MSISKQKYELYASSPAAFREDLLVDVDGVVRRFGSVMDPWQRDDFATIDPGLQLCNGRATEPATNRVYLERGRGHSKTTDLAVLCCWALAFATRPIKGYAFAADKDQAGLLKDAMATIVRLNPWLALLLEVQKGLVLNIAKGHPGNGARLDIFTSDVASSYGILPDFIVADELTHWEGDGSLWHSIISSAAKRSNCLLTVIANAGFVDSWQWQVREAARTSDDWIFSRLDGPVASWFTPERLAEQRKMLPAIAYERLWNNNWTTGGGDALTPQVIEAAFIDGLQPLSARLPGSSYVAGVDLGLTRDCAAVVVLAVPSGGGAGKIRMVHNKLWRPTPGTKINLLDVQRHLLQLDEAFGLEFVGFDPWQMEHLAQTLEADTGHRSRNARRIFGSQPWLRELPPTPANLREQASLTIEFFNDHRIQLYECPELRRDLLKLRVEEKNYGVRLTSPRDGDGHGDTFSAFGLALLLAHELAGKHKPVAGAPRSSWDYVAAFESRQKLYAAEEQRMREMPEDNPLRDLMRLVGRVR